jgi:hypothetical protein
LPGADQAEEAKTDPAPRIHPDERDRRSHPGPKRPESPSEPKQPTPTATHRSKHGTRNKPTRPLRNQANLIPAPPYPLRFQKIKTRHLFSRLESRSLSELTRQIAPPTKNGHAPPPTESRKSSQSVNPYSVRAG